MITLRDILNSVEKGETAGDGWTEYTLHEDDLDQNIMDLIAFQEWKAKSL
jgi:hypothetical protein